MGVRVMALVLLVIATIRNKRDETLRGSDRQRIWKTDATKSVSMLMGSARIGANDATATRADAAILI